MKKEDKNYWNNEMLEEALRDYYESCVRTGNQNLKYNAQYFFSQNKHMNGLTYGIVYNMLEDINKQNDNMMN